MKKVSKISKSVPITENVKKYYHSQLDMAMSIHNERADYKTVSTNTKELQAYCIQSLMNFLRRLPSGSL